MNAHGQKIFMSPYPNSIFHNEITLFWHKQREVLRKKAICTFLTLQIDGFASYSTGKNYHSSWKETKKQTHSELKMESIFFDAFLLDLAQQTLQSYRHNRYLMRKREKEEFREAQRVWVYLLILLSILMCI